MSVGSGAILKEGKVQVTFWPEGEHIRVPLETTLLDAAKIAGVDLTSSCGDDGLCGKCRVIVRQGNVTAQPTSLLSREEIRRGYVLACQPRWPATWSWKYLPNPVPRLPRSSSMLTPSGFAPCTR